jgi:hypothetical protein
MELTTRPGGGLAIFKPQVCFRFEFVVELKKCALNISAMGSKIAIPFFSNSAYIG